jgi:predicted metal-dependent phosphoesterase TrpH
MCDPEWSEVLSTLSRLPDIILAKPDRVRSPYRSAVARSPSCSRRTLRHGIASGQPVSNSHRGISIDFHVHTWFSHDCLMPPRLVIEIARRRGLNGIAITDHNTVAGALTGVDQNHYSDFLVIPGVEVKSDLGDLIGLYVDREIESRHFAEVIQEIHEKGGVAYLPHPIRTFGAQRAQQIYAAYPDIDFWEMYNGRYEDKEFSEALKLFQSVTIPGLLCGSDAHFPWEIGICRTNLADVPRDPQSLLALSKDAELEAKPRGKMALSSGIMLGALVKALKKGDYALAARYIATAQWKAVKKAVHMIVRTSR